MIEQLRKVGLTKNEAKIYAGILGRGILKVSQIIKISGVGSGKIYEILYGLQKKGLISSIIKNGIRYFSAVNPDNIAELVKEKKKQVVATERELKKLLPELKERYKSSQLEYNTEIYIGDNGLKSALNLIINSLKKKEEICSLGISGQRSTYINNLWYHFSKEAIRKKKCKLFLIFADNESKTKEIMKEQKKMGSSIKYFSIFNFVPITITSEYILINDYLSSNHILIKSESVVRSFKDMFNGSWSISKNTSV